MRHGLTCNIYRAKGYERCPNGGISEHHDEVLLVGDGVNGPFSEEDAAKLGIPVVVLVCRKGLAKNGGDYLHAEPIAGSDCMAGGAFIYTCDSRFPSDYPISLHDRRE